MLRDYYITGQHDNDKIVVKLSEAWYSELWWLVRTTNVHQYWIEEINGAFILRFSIEGYERFKELINNKTKSVIRCRKVSGRYKRRCDIFVNSPNKASKDFPF